MLLKKHSTIFVKRGMKTRHWERRKTRGMTGRKLKEGAMSLKSLQKTVAPLLINIPQMNAYFAQTSLAQAAEDRQ